MYNFTDKGNAFSFQPAGKRSGSSGSFDSSYSETESLKGFGIVLLRVFKIYAKSPNHQTLISTRIKKKKNLLFAKYWANSWLEICLAELLNTLGSEKNKKQQLHYFPCATVTNCHNLGGLKQQKIILSHL